MLSFEVLHVEIAQKLQYLEFSVIFSNFLKDFQFLPFFGCFWRKYSEKEKNELEFWGQNLIESQNR